MQIAVYFDKQDGFEAAVGRVTRYETAGLDCLWVPEGYRFDAISQIAFIAARTRTLRIGTGVASVFSRTPAMVAMTAAGCDAVSQGRFLLGLGASGPQVVEGWHGVPYEKPMQRIAEYIEACRLIWSREKFVYSGQTISAPLPTEQGSGLGKPLHLIETPVRPRVPIWWASIKDRSVTATAAVADGWLTMQSMYIPEKWQAVWGAAVANGTARRQTDLAPLEISAGGVLAIGDDLTGQAQLDQLAARREWLALYIGAMGAREKNFYNDLCTAYGYREEAARIQELSLAGNRKEAAKIVPDEWLVNANLVGTPEFVADRVTAFKNAGVTMLSVVPIGLDPVAQLAALRKIVNSLALSQLSQGGAMTLVTTDRQGPVLIITLNRPDARNAINAPMAAELGAALDLLEGEPDLRVAILRAEVTEPRPVFCAGHDLKTIEEEQNGGPRAYTDKGGFAGFVKYPRTKPVIAAVDGLATSGGFEIVLACDLVVATKRSSFALAEVRWNAVAGSGALFRLPWLVGRPVAMDMILSGEPVDAQRAHQLGLVGTLVDTGNLDRAALARAAAICKNGPIAVAASFRVADKAFVVPVEQLWAMIDEAKHDVLRSRDLTAGLAAFATRTEPVFKGR